MKIFKIMYNKYIHIMIIPIRCFTCGKVIGHLWEEYKNALQNDFNKEVKELDIIKYIDINDDEKTVEEKTLDKLGLDRYCCRRMLLSNNDLCEIIS
jgi:DNA-directed RNA polymerase subunit N (RpoN/RPB10)